MRKFDLLMSDEVVVCTHNAHDWRKENREGAEHCDEGCSSVDELPRLHDPRDSSVLRL